MYQLSESEIDYIQADLTRLGIRTASIRDNLLDHICILLEDRLAKREDFEKQYRATLAEFYIDDLAEIETQARLLTLSRNHITLTKLQFFFLLLGLLVCPYLTFLLNGLSTSQNGFSRDLWGPALAYLSWPISSLVVLFLIPQRWDPPIPGNAKILIGVRPFLVVISS